MYVEKKQFRYKTLVFRFSPHLSEKFSETGYYIPNQDQQNIPLNWALLNTKPGLSLRFDSL